MKFTIKKMVLAMIIVFAGMTTYAQGDVQSIVGAKGSSAEMEYQNKGYTHIKTEKQGMTIYSYWWKQKTRTCSCAKMEEGRVVTVSKAMPFDCNKDQHGSGHHVSGYVDVQDLKGWYASSAWIELKGRGFREVHHATYSGTTHKLFHNKATGQCVEFLQRGDDIVDLHHSDDCNKYLK